jgi:hypothetical protein
MSLVFEVEIELPVPPARAFEVLRDHAQWHAWMPASFRPVGPSPGPLTVGARCTIAIAGAPFDTTITVKTVDAPRELRWGGGVPGVMTGDHSFFFEASGTGTRVRSVETWSGFLTALMASRLRRQVPAVLREQLEGLRRAVA